MLEWDFSMLLFIRYHSFKFCSCSQLVQAGVVPALRDFGNVHLPSTHMVFYASYMPPRSLASVNSQNVHDLHKAPDSVSFCADFYHLQKSLQSKSDEKLSFLLAMSKSADPQSVDNCLRQQGAASLNMNIASTKVYWPHFSGEHVPLSMDQLALVVYRVVFAP
eukprot:m.148301 g.148301  ORF g.148301 m.148301 type:complete len:163 (+) comp14995_c0_seq31:1604-2092(+)